MEKEDFNTIYFEAVKAGKEGQRKDLTKCEMCGFTKEIDYREKAGELCPKCGGDRWTMVEKSRCAIVRHAVTWAI